MLFDFEQRGGEAAPQGAVVTQTTYFTESFCEVLEAS